MAASSEYDQRRVVAERFKDAFCKYELHAHPLLVGMCIDISLKQTKTDAPNGRFTNNNGMIKSIMYVCSRFLDMSISKDVLLFRDNSDAKIDVNSKILALFPNIFNVAVRSSVLNHLASLMMSDMFGIPVLFSEYESKFPEKAAKCTSLVNKHFQKARAQGGKIPCSDRMSYAMHEQAIAREVFDAINTKPCNVRSMKRSYDTMRT
jgi:hypothetical protein